MRDLIKILITLVFISGAYCVGSYMANDKCTTHVSELNTKSEMEMKLILQLYDSLNILKIELGKEKAKNNIDTLKYKQVMKQKKE